MCAILYVDDQPSHLTLFRKTFSADYKVLTVNSGPEAIEMIRGKEIFLIVADYNMPGMTGIDFLTKAEEISPRAMRILLSAYFDDNPVKEAIRRLRTVEVLEKPWKLVQMRGFIQKALEHYNKNRSDH